MAPCRLASGRPRVFTPVTYRRCACIGAGRRCRSPCSRRRCAPRARPRCRSRCAHRTVPGQLRGGAQVGPMNGASAAPNRHHRLLNDPEHRRRPPPRVAPTPYFGRGSSCAIAAPPHPVSTSDDGARSPNVGRKSAASTHANAEAQAGRASPPVGAAAQKHRNSGQMDVLG